LFGNAAQSAIAGRLALQAEIESAGRSPAAFIGSLAGNGTVTLEQARIAGLNPDVFAAVLRAVDLGIPIEGKRIREFAAGVLDNAALPVERAEATISIGAGHARLSKIVTKGAAADLEATANIDFSDATVDALLTLTGPPTSPGSARPTVLVTLKGALDNPKRTVDASRLASWLTLRAVEQKSQTLDAIERSGRDSAPPRPAPADRQPPPPPEIRGSAPLTAPRAAGGPAAPGQAPPLPPPVSIPAGRSPSGAIIRPPGLVGAQN
jgi:large subunit ribosomal protein L24